MNLKAFGFILLTIFIVSLGLNLYFYAPPDDLTSQAKVKEIETSDGQFDPSETTAFFNNKAMTAPTQKLALKPEKRILSAVPPDKKWIEIDLTHQVLRAHEAERIVYEFPVSTGLWGRTPTGDFRIWIKLRYTKMSGGSRALGTYYYLPNVPYTMYFYKAFGIHGTYWHNNFGHPMSHGCVNMRTPDAEKLFHWADPVIASSQNMIRSTKSNPGTRVVIHGTVPKG